MIDDRLARRSGGVARSLLPNADAAGIEHAGVVLDGAVVGLGEENPRAAPMIVGPVMHAEIVLDAEATADFHFDPRAGVVLAETLLDEHVANVNIEPQSHAIVCHRLATADNALTGASELHAAGFPALGESLHIVVVQNQVFQEKSVAVTAQPLLTVVMRTDAAERSVLAPKERPVPFVHSTRQSSMSQ